MKNLSQSIACPKPLPLIQLQGYVLIMLHRLEITRENPVCGLNLPDKKVQKGRICHFIMDIYDGFLTRIDAHHQNYNLNLYIHV
jgi:hypothetical protein